MSPRIKPNTTFRWILKLPRRAVMTAVLVLSVVGAFAIRRTLFDVYVMIGAGVLGWFLESHKKPSRRFHKPARPAGINSSRVMNAIANSSRTRSPLVSKIRGPGLMS